MARFITPRGVAVSPSSAIIVADTGNQVVRRILLPPAITALSPAQAHTLDSVTITGERFDGRSPAGNTVRFTKTGGGQTAAQVTVASRTQLTVIAPADAATGPVTVRADTNEQWRDKWEMHHYMIYLDSAGCFEVIAESWSAARPRKLFHKTSRVLTLKLHRPYGCGDLHHS